jgi:hypothetical protein
MDGMTERSLLRDHLQRVKSVDSITARSEKGERAAVSLPSGASRPLFEAQLEWRFQLLRKFSERFPGFHALINSAVQP